MKSLLLALLLHPQDGELDRILQRFAERRGGAKDEQQFARLVVDTRTELESFLKANPAHKDAPRAAFHIAETYLSGDNLDLAGEKLQAFVRDHPSSEQAATARFALGEILLRKEDDAGARAAFDEFVKLHPGDSRALFAKMFAGLALQHEGKYDEAALRLQAARADHLDRRESWGAVVQRAIVSHLQERNAEARRLLEEVVRDCPDASPVAMARQHLAGYLRVGADAPAFAARDVEGRELTREALGGRVILVHFFDPAAGEAQADVEAIRRAKEEAAKAGKGDALAPVSVSISPDRKGLAAFRIQMKADWPVVWEGKEEGGELSRAFDSLRTPSLTVIDRAGRIRYFNLTGRDLRNAVAKLLEEKPDARR